MLHLVIVQRNCFENVCFVFQQLEKIPKKYIYFSLVKQVMKLWSEKTALIYINIHLSNNGKLQFCI